MPDIVAIVGGTGKYYTAMLQYFNFSHSRWIHVYCDTYNGDHNFW